MTWTYVNTLNGNIIESTDLGFLFYQLRSLKGLSVPETVSVDLLIRGFSIFQCTDGDNVFEARIYSSQAQEAASAASLGA